MDHNNNSNNNDDEEQVDSSRSLRVISMLSWIFVVGLGVPYSTDNNIAVPAVGIVPMVFSACTALYAVGGRQKKRHRGLTLALDMFCAIFLFATFIPSVVLMAGVGRSVSANQTVLGTLGAAPMMLNLFCHLWFILREMRRRWPRLFSQTEKVCPHCHESLRKPERKHGYIRVADRDEAEARDSCDKSRSHPGDCYEDAEEEGSAIVV